MISQVENIVGSILTTSFPRSLIELGNEIGSLNDEIQT